jgi:hypothetical protein
MFVFLPVRLNPQRRNINAILKAHDVCAPLRIAADYDVARISAAAYAVTDALARQHLGAAIHALPGKLVPELFAFSVLLCELWAWTLERDSSQVTLALASQFASRKTVDASLAQSLAKAICAAGLVQAAKLARVHPDEAKDIRAAAAAMALHNPLDCQTRECLSATFVQVLFTPSRLSAS